jgi:hypothetical protein
MRRVLTGLLLCYLGSYVAFRTARTEVSARDNRPYVIFPLAWQGVYYLYRPLPYADSLLTGMQFHLGPHTEGENACSGSLFTGQVFFPRRA